MVKFFGPYPTFGTKNNRLPRSRFEQSPYYWWWECLRRNKEYLACCESNGQGKYADIYKDFDDIRNVEFRVWWRQKGVELFAEKQSDYIFKELDSKDEVPSEWEKEDFIFLQVPLTYDKKTLKKYFNQLLIERHGRKRGRPTLAMKNSTAKYKLNGAYTIANLRLCLQVYDYYQEARSGKNKMPVWQIGKEMGLLKDDSMSLKKEDYADRLVRRNKLAATVSRYVAQAKRRIEGAAMGKFPVV